MSLVKWDRPVRDKFDKISYTSKCERFVIHKREWCAPYVHVSYDVIENGRTHECGSLRELCDGFVERESQDSLR